MTGCENIEWFSKDMTFLKRIQNKQNENYIIRQSNRYSVRLYQNEKPVRLRCHTASETKVLKII